MREMTILTGALASDLDRFEAFRKDDRMGYFYILEYTNGMVKIGSTRNPKARMQSLHYAAPIYSAGAETQRVAVSAPHTLFRASEARLHGQLAAFRIKGTELFRMPFEDALRLCNDYWDQARHEAAAHKLLDFILLDNDMREMSPNQISQIFQVVGKTISACSDRAEAKRKATIDLLRTIPGGNAR